MYKLLVIGAGGHGRVVKETAEAMGRSEKIDFLDDNSELAIGKCKDFKQYINEYTYAFVAFGNNELRMKWIEDLIEASYINSPHSICESISRNMTRRYCLCKSCCKYKCSDRERLHYQHRSIS